MSGAGEISEDKKEELRNAGLKVTGPRMQVLQLLEEAARDNRHLSADDLYLSLQQQGTHNIGLATVYRVLTQFESAGLVMRHNFEGGHAVFELSTDDHHDHMVCLETGTVIEFHDEAIEKRQREIAAEHGYELVDHSLVLHVRPVKGKEQGKKKK